MQANPSDAWPTPMLTEPDPIALATAKKVDQASPLIHNTEEVIKAYLAALPCPRCKGTGGNVETTIDGTEMRPCSTCNPSGYAAWLGEPPW